MIYVLLYLLVGVLWGVWCILREFDYLIDKTNDAGIPVWAGGLGTIVVSMVFWPVFVIFKIFS